MKPNANRRLRRAMQTAGLTYDDLARETKANVKTVQRWVYEGRMPRPQRAEKVAEYLGVEPFWLWPELGGSRMWDRNGAMDGCQLYTTASDLPPTFLHQLMLSAQREVCIATDSEWLLARLPLLLQRPLVGPTQAAPLRRLLVSPTLGSSVAVAVRGVEVRTHRSVRGSVLRFDNTVLVIAGGLGLDVSSSPVLYLSRETEGGPFDSIVGGLAKTWTSARARRESLTPEASRPDQ